MNEEEAQERLRNLAKWAEKYEPPAWWAAPSYVAPTITERIEPWATEYDELSQEHPDYWAVFSECSEPDPEFYQPTEKLYDLDDRLDALRAKAFREVPNPDYDPLRAAAWREEEKSRRRRPYYMSQITVGQSSNPEPVRIDDETVIFDLSQSHDPNIAGAAVKLLGETLLADAVRAVVAVDDEGESRMT